MSGNSFSGCADACNAIIVESLRLTDVESLLLVFGYILMGYGLNSYMKVIGSTVKAKVTGAKKSEKPYSRNVKLRSAITIEDRAVKFCMQDGVFGYGASNG